MKIILTLAIILLFPVMALAEIPGIEGSNALELIYTMEEVGIKPQHTDYFHFDHGKIYGGYYYEYFSETLYDADGGARISYEVCANQANEILSADFLMSGADNKFISAAAVIVAPDDEAGLQALVFVEQHLIDREMETITIGDAIWRIYPRDNLVMLSVQDVEADACFWEMILADMQE